MPRPPVYTVTEIGGDHPAHALCNALRTALVRHSTGDAVDGIDALVTVLCDEAVAQHHPLEHLQRQIAVCHLFLQQVRRSSR